MDQHISNAVSFNVRACFTIAADRIYRVEIRNGVLYFLRIGGQFNVDRGNHQPMPGKMAAVMILAAGEALFRKHNKEELIARDPNQDPEKLLAIHPHNYKLAAGDISSAVLLPKRWFLALFRPHYGRLIIQQADGKRQEYHFESDADLNTANTYLPAVLGDKFDSRIR